jgi:hypothetical protein
MAANLIKAMAIEAKAPDQDSDTQNRQNSPRPPRLNGLFSPIERNLS